MAVVKPFRAFRPKPGTEAAVAALPYDVYNRAEAVEVVRENPDSFLAIDRAETQFDAGTDTYDPKVYEKAAQMLQSRIREGGFVREERDSYYLYELTMDGRTQTGIVGCASVEDYESGTIRKHENTRADKEEDRIRHVDTTNMQTGPIFLAYRQNDALKGLIAAGKKKAPLCDFTADDGIRHRVWILSDPEVVKKIGEAFAAVPRLYIADGHHRCASAVRVSRMRRDANPEHTGQEQYNFFLSVIFPDEDLKILDYNRVVKDLAGLSEEEFLSKVSEKFRVSPAPVSPYQPTEKGTFGMYLAGTWYRLEAKPEIRSTDEVEGLDVSILQRELLGPVLGIEDPKTDKRIDFVGGIRGLHELERRVGMDCRVAFSMYPTSIGELFAVADKGRLMPPKSTWFEPKLRSGLFLHSLSE